MAKSEPKFIPGHFTVKEFEHYRIHRAEQHNKWAVLITEGHPKVRSSVRIKIRMH